VVSQCKLVFLLTTEETVISVHYEDLAMNENLHAARLALVALWNNVGCLTYD